MMDQFQVSKQDLRQFRIVSSPKTTFEEDGIHLEVERFAFTANNLTYYMTGDKLGYWQFFPAIENNQDNKWGVIPVWGIGKVVKSTQAEIIVGSRYFGYFPPASHLHMTSAKMSAGNIVDTSSHRRQLPQGYNVYRPIGHDENANALQQNLQMLLWPLYITSYCLWDVIEQMKPDQPKHVIILSASSKTSLGLAYALNQNAYTVVGVTSPRNADFIDSLNVYDQVVTYDQLAHIESSDAVVVDMSGNSEVKTKLEAHLSTSLRRYIQVGLTHWQDAGLQQEGEFFFAPEHIQTRMAQIGQEVFHAKSSQFISQAMQWSASWLNVRVQHGLSELEKDFTQICSGKINAYEGLIYSPMA